MSFLGGLFESKGNSNPAFEIETKRRGSIIPMPSSASSSDWSYGYKSKWADYNYAAERGLDLVVWVYRCVDAIANAQAPVTIYCHKKGDPASHYTEVDDVFDLLNSYPNPHENSFNFRYRLTGMLLLSTKGAFIELLKTSNGVVKEMYLHHPDTVKVHRGNTNKTPILKYEIIGENSEPRPVKTEDMLWIMIKPRPDDPFTQLTPITSAGLAIDTDYLARKFNAAFLKNDGRPNMLITVDGDLDADTTAEILEQFKGGPSSAGVPVIIEGQSMEVVDMQGKPRDAQWQEAITNAKDTILAAFGVPESVLGNASGRCLRATEKVHLADGTIKRAEELVGQKVPLVQTWNGETRAVEARIEYAKKEPIYKLTTFSGRTIETNGEHPLYMATSVARGKYKRDFFAHAWTPMHAVKLHHSRHDAIGDGTYTEVAIPLHFNPEEGLDYDFDQAFLDGKELKNVPGYIFKASSETKRAFLSGIFSHHGRVSQHTAFDVVVPSREYASNLQIILQRLGINAYVNTKKLNHVVSIGGKVNIVNFLSQVEIVGDNEAKAIAVFERLSTEKSREINFHRSDDLPEGFIWDRVSDVELIGVDQTVAITINQGDNSYLSTFLEHNTYNNAESEDEGFWKLTMKPHCEAIARGLEPITGSIKDDIKLKFNYNEIDVLERVERKRLDTIKQDWLSGALSQNEYLQAIGSPKINDPVADVYVLSNGIPVGKTEDVEEYFNRMRIFAEIQAPKPQQGIGANPYLNATQVGDGVIGGRNDMITGQTAAVGINTGQTINQQAARTLRSARHNGTSPAAVNPGAVTAIGDRVQQLMAKDDSEIIEIKQIDMSDPHKHLRHKMHGFLEGSLESWSNRQLEVVSSRIEHTKVRQGTRHWDGEIKGTLKPLDTSYIVEENAWTDQLKSAVHSGILRTLKHRASEIINELKDAGHVVPKAGMSTLEVLVGPTYDEDIKSIADCATDYVAEASKQQTRLLARHITVLDADEKSIAEIKSTIEPEAFDRNRWIIALAKTATTAALEDLSDLIYSNLGDKAYKIWCTAHDEHYRPEHEKLNSVKLSVKDSFKVGESELRYPCDGYGDEDSACSCWVYYGVDS